MIADDLDDVRAAICRVEDCVDLRVLGELWDEASDLLFELPRSPEASALKKQLVKNCTDKIRELLDTRLREIENEVASLVDADGKLAALDLAEERLDDELWCYLTDLPRASALERRADKSISILREPMQPKKKKAKKPKSCGSCGRRKVVNKQGFCRSCVQVRSFHTKVVGVTQGKRQSYLKKIRDLDALDLVPEPTNPVDENAIMVLTQSRQHIGYLRASLAKEVANNIEHDFQFTALVMGVTGRKKGNLGVNILVVEAPSPVEDGKLQEFFDERVPEIHANYKEEARIRGELDSPGGLLKALARSVGLIKRRK